MSDKKMFSDKDFVNAVLTCNSYEQLALLLGLEKASVQARAAKLRKAGVNLPTYERQKKTVDVAGLNALIG